MKFEATASAADERSTVRERQNTIRVPETIERVREHFTAQPSTSTSRASQELEIPRTTLRRILKQDLKMKPYKIQINQPLRPFDMERRFDFANEIIERIENGSMSLERVWWSDESHFDVSGYVNKQNWRHWGTDNPHLAIVRPLNPRRLTVWCAISSAGIIGPVIVNGTVTSQKYCEMLNESFIPVAHGLNMVENAWFMQDGARPHRTEEVFNILEEHFGNRIIGLDAQQFTGGGITWPPYSPDLNPCDFYLWGSLKDTVYRDGIDTLDNLEMAIRQRIEAIPHATLQAVCGEFEKRLRNVIAARGSHFENLIY